LFSKLFLNGELLDRDALDTPVSGDDIVAVLAPAAGG
jgi:molybdopterin converting factor small subunit